MDLSRNRESAFKKLINDKLAAGGALVFNVHGHLMQKSGWPDTQIYHARFTGHIEYKENDRRLEALQRRVIRELCVRGAKVVVLRRILDAIIAQDAFERPVMDCTVLFTLSGVNALDVVNKAAELAMRTTCNG